MIGLGVFVTVGMSSCAGTSKSGVGPHASSPTNSDPEAPASVSPTPGSSAQVAVDLRPRLELGDDCAPGSYHAQTPALCLALPPGYRPAPDPSPTTLVFRHSTAPPIVLRWSGATEHLFAAHRAAIDRLSDLDTQPLKGSTRDGRGAFVFVTETQPSPRGPHHILHAASVVRGDSGTVVWCTASASAQGNHPRALFEACQSLVVK